jgi:hypothetical protein
METLFSTLLAPLLPFFKDNGTKIDENARSSKLFFEDFFRKIVFAFQQNIESLHGLSLELKTSQLACNLELNYTPFSTLKDAFHRFKASDFERIYQVALSSFDWRTCKSFEELGKLCIIDGSLFPTLLSMQWTSYKTSSNACKLHLCLELNRMLPTEFWIGSGNSSERAFIQNIAQKDITYIADRGYFSFELVEILGKIGAFFVFRLKGNILTTMIEDRAITHHLPMPKCFEKVKDQLVTFTNMPNLGTFRLVAFHVGDKHFSICTNRTDLNTLQIIMLYAYRWQIELMFKFLKRTMTGLHLFNNSENGVKIQFYILLTLAVLQLRLKQDCQSKQEEINNTGEIKQKDCKENDTQIQDTNYLYPDASKFIKDISLFLYKSWKISKSFLIILKNNICQILDSKLIHLLATH